MPRHELDDLLREQLPGLRRFARWLTRDPGNADDLVQSTLERALRSWTSRRADGELRPWLFSILYHLHLDQQRRAQRYTGLLGLLGREVREQPSAEREVIAQSTLQAAEKLPLEQRSLLYWASVEGLSYQDIATLLDVPMGTVMSRLSRAREALRRASEGEVASPSLRIHKS